MRSLQKNLKNGGSSNEALGMGMRRVVVIYDLKCPSSSYVAFDLLRDALSAIFGLSELKPYHQATLLTPIQKRIKEDPEEDPADYTADGGDNDDNESFDDEDDNDDDV
ncbi:hypothetical protein Tco_1225105 [Tanacetum coccineum]